ncbi:MAG: YlxM family DNA-binding protein [Oscillospiraceae bacterium]|nr:YlxM family DNA-binding protein [Oscillospiraceae bacterium]
MTEETLYRTMLFDFYGELLTAKQKEYFDLHYNADYSLGEIAEMTGISRQGVWDIIKRAEETLRKTEEKTGLIRRFRENQAAVAEMETTIEALMQLTDGKAKELAAALSDSLNKLKG